MRVLHVSSEKTWRGGEQQIAYLIKGAGNTEHYAFCRENSPFTAWCEDKGIPYVAASFHPLHWVSSARKLIRFCRTNRLELVHCHTGKAHILAYMALLLGLDIPVVVSRRVAVRPSEGFLTRYRYNHPGIRRVICVSHYIRKVMQEYLKDPDKAITIHSGIDPDKFSAPVEDLHERLQVPVNTTLVGTVAALSKEKGMPVWLNAAALIHQENKQTHFVIVGDGPLRESLENQAEELGIRKHMTFTGFANPGDYLPGFNVFLFTSSQEGLGTSLLDAMACGVPVVASSAGGIPEIVLDKKTGLTSAPGDVEGFAREVLRIIQDQGLAAQLSSNAADHLKQFTWEHMARETQACYEQVIGSR